MGKVPQGNAHKGQGQGIYLSTFGGLQKMYIFW